MRGVTRVAFRGMNLLGNPARGGHVNTTTLIIIIVVAVVVILLLAIYFAIRRRRAQRTEEQRERTREEFGGEYERAAQERGSEEEAERELEERNFVTDPAQSDEETERSLAVMHPDVADDYREARRSRADVVTGGTSEESSGEDTTEEMRQAIRKYRAVYQRLVRG